MLNEKLHLLLSFSFLASTLNELSFSFFFFVPVGRLAPHGHSGE